jgi:hypothetical protein
MSPDSKVRTMGGRLTETGRFGRSGYSCVSRRAGGGGDGMRGGSGWVYFPGVQRTGSSLMPLMNIDLR